MTATPHLPLGTHLLADLSGIAPERLRDGAALEQLLRGAAIAAGAQVLHSHFHSFGAGMGGMTETCGAISGAVAIMGFVMSDGMENPKTKGQTYKLSREIAKRFGEKNTTTVCGTLKGIGSDKGPLRSCPGCIDDAVEIACDVLKQLAE